MSSQRQLRVGEEIRHLLSGYVMRGGFRDPDLQGVNVTVTEVRVSPDLKNATAYVMPLGGADGPRIVAGLNRAAPYLRSQLAKDITLRHTPALRFELDTSFDEAAKIDALLRQNKKDSEDGA